MTSTPSLAVLWARFFTQRLRPQRQASPHTLSASRDTFRLLLLFPQPRLRVRMNDCAHRRARVRTDRAAPAGCDPGDRRPSPCAGQGTPGTRHAAEQADDGRRASLAVRARARRDPHLVSQRPWWMPPCRRGARHPRAADRGGLSDVPVAPAAAGGAACPAAHDGHGALTGRGGSRCHRTVARAGIGRDHADLPASDPRGAGGHLSQDHTTRGQAWTLSAR